MSEGVMVLPPQPQKKSDVAIIAENINDGLQAFEERKAELIALQKEAHGLKIESIDDKEAIKTVVTIRRKLKSARVAIEKEGKAMRDPLTKISKNIKSKEDELVAIIEPTERELEVQEKWVEDELQKIEDARIKAEEERIQLRVDGLAKYGFALDYAVLKTIDDASYEKFLASAKAEHEKELAAKEEERKRAEAEKEELERLRKQAADAQRIIDENNERIRIEQEKIENEKKELELQKQREEDLKREKILATGQARFEILKGLGFENETATNLSVMTEQEWNSCFDGYKKTYDSAQEELRKKYEAERLASASDKEKFETVVDQLESIKIPEMQSENAKNLSEEVNGLLVKIVNHILKNI